MEPERISDRTVPGVFFRQAERLGPRVLARHHDGTEWREVTWARMWELVLNLAASLVGNGVQAGDRVLLRSENRLEWLFSDLAIMTAGGVTVPIYPNVTARVAQQIADNSGARLAIVSRQALADGLRIEKVVRMDGELPEWVKGGAAPETVAEVERRAGAVDPEELATIVYTSGTTGEPKGVMLAHRNLVDMTRSCLQVFDIGEEDSMLSYLPYAHVFERINGVLVLMAAGGSLWLARGVNRLVDDLQECQPTVMVSVPRVYEKMHQRVMAQVGQASPRRQALFRWAVEHGRRRSRGRRTLFHPIADRLVLSPLRHRLTGGGLRFFVSGGAPLSREVEEFFWSFGVKIFNGWGMTETAGGATTNSERRHEFETVGPPLPGAEIKIAEDGEILVHSPGNMLGYFRNQAATDEVLQDGWILTGDIGELDEEGFLRITDRKKDLIKTAGGKFVAPQPLEARLQEETVIERAVVIGDDRPYVVALIVPEWNALRAAAGVSGDPESLVDDEQVREAVQRSVDALNRDFSSWENIKYFKLLGDDFSEERGELTPTLKVKRRAVQERHRDLIEEMYSGKVRPAGATY